LGKLHAATKTLDTSKLEFFHCKTFWGNVQKNVNTDWLEFEYNTILAWLETQDESRDFGLNHGDFRPGNAFWDGERVWLIDFDEPVWHWFGNDVARAMLEFTGNLEDRHAKLEVFMKGYRKHHDLDFSRADFAMLSRFRVMLMWLWALEGSGIGDDIYHLKARILEPFKW
jgi:Ser/Thr protein kinase RdoA (MazF antagonist)